ncbi:hypothetical protein IFR35_02995 [Pseudomonas fluorescens]|uniref:hypothetical protein n=1 Tax=Pseudomonas TaxID=286 RepID=UPI000DD3243C|nr:MULTISPECIES: hypothetical protein [Pseudomonas]MBD8191434.1 hypothetical protein [Pseudomonas fluorescens]MBD8225581.1 hypothetical protein [Pseudomonas fluorescens]MBD8237790.1 hypothetical protein [Pseudomonas fluorescens]MBD8783183.1 hypothetical protein [Pseudomonas fluorescens]MBD8816605.1 hypothetical protein [Pseudomonas fluorescens]
MVWFYLGIGSVILMLLSFPLIFCAMYKKLDAAEGYVQYSTYLVVQKHIFRNAHFDGRPQRVFAMATIILIPKILQWRRLVLVEDVERIPKHLRYWMVIPTLTACISFAGMFISWFFI